MKLVNLVKRGLDWFGKYWALVIVILFAFPAAEALIMRYMLNRPTIWSQELTCMIFGAYFMIGGAYAESCSAHVAMDIFYQKYRGVWKMLADTLIIVSCGVFCYILFTKGGGAALKAMRIEQRSDSLWAPLIWPVRLCIPIASLLLFVRTLITYLERMQASIAALREGRAAKSGQRGADAP